MSMTKIRIRSLATLAASVALAAFLAIGTQAPAPSSDVRAVPALRRLANRFVENRGQWPSEVEFGLSKPGSTTFFQRHAWTHVRHGDDKAVAIRMGFAGRSAAEVVGEHRLTGTQNWFVGRDPDKWVRGARGYARIRYHEAFDGVDVIVRNGRDPSTDFEYDLLLQPGASIESIVMSCRGQNALRVAGDGALELETDLGTMRQLPPVTWAVEPGGARRPLACRYVRIDDEHFGFAVPEWDGAKPLVIDPGILWSTFIGGTNYGAAVSVERDRVGNITVLGYTLSADFPTTVGAYHRKFKAAPYRPQAFVCQFSPDGKKLIFSTFLGGSNGDYPHDFHLHAAGWITITGETMSSDFPTTKGCFQPKYGGARDAFVARLDASGSRLLWATYFGGGGQTGDETATALDVDRAGNVVIVGHARGGTMPVTPGVFQSKSNSARSVNPFVAKFDNAGAKLIFSTFCGGSNYGLAKAVAIDAKGFVTFAGHSGSTDYPTTKNAFQTKAKSTGIDYEAFVTRMDPAGKTLVWSTYIGGGGMDTIEDIVLHPSGDVSFAGWTRSSNFPTTPGVYQPAFGGGTTLRGDAMVGRLDASGSALVYATYLGGTIGDVASSLSIDAAGNPTIVGSSGSTNYPTTPGAFQKSWSGWGYTYAAEGVVSRLSHDGTKLLFSSFIGGTNIDELTSVAVLPDGSVAVAGDSYSTDFPITANAYQSKLKGRFNTTVAVLDCLPLGVSRVGSATECNGPVMLYPHGDFSAGSQQAELVVGNAPVRAPGFLVFGGRGLASGFVVGGARIYVDPSVWLFAVPITSDPAGRATIPLGLQQLPKGFRFAVQTAWVNNANCVSPALLSASPALDVVLR